jgi:hypothetical protein
MRNLDEIFKEASAAKQRAKQVRAHLLVVEGMLLALARTLGIPPDTILAAIDERLAAKDEPPDLALEVRDQALRSYHRFLRAHPLTRPPAPGT